MHKLMEFLRTLSVVLDRIMRRIRNLFGKETSLGPLQKGDEVFYGVRDRRGRPYQNFGTILGFVGIKKAILDEGGEKIVRRSISRLRPFVVGPTQVRR